MTKTALFSIINGFLLIVLVLLEFHGVISFSLPISYNWMKIIHIFAVILFMGNMIIGPVWFFLAFYSNDKNLLQFSDKLAESYRYDFHHPRTGYCSDYWIIFSLGAWWIGPATLACPVCLYVNFALGI